MGKLFLAVVISLALFGVSVFGLVYCNSPRHNENVRYVGSEVFIEESDYYGFNNLITGNEKVIVDEWQVLIDEEVITGDLQALIDNGEVTISRDTPIEIEYSLSAPSDMEFNYHFDLRVAKKNAYIFTSFAVAEYITFLLFIVFLWYLAGIGDRRRDGSNGHQTFHTATNLA